jgi:hypothetical protein
VTYTTDELRRYAVWVRARRAARKFVDMIASWLEGKEFPSQVDRQLMELATSGGCDNPRCAFRRFHEGRCLEIPRQERQ